MLVRDGDLGLEVFMVRRAHSASFVGGMFVFPGGTLDPADRDPAIEAVCDGLTDSEASARLGIDAGGLAFWVAAVRECFEEAGLLLALGAGRPAHRLRRPDRRGPVRRAPRRRSPATEGR